jgi:hypothetical protein
MDTQNQKISWNDDGINQKNAWISAQKIHDQLKIAELPGLNISAFFLESRISNPIIYNEWAQ